MVSIKKNKILFSAFCSLLCVLWLCGCTTLYTIESGGKKYNNGYVVKRNDVIVPEFTVDKQRKAPEDKKIAEERFKRRKKKILYYYKEMGYFGSTIWETHRAFLSFFLAPFRAPIEGAKYHKYERDPEYRAKIDAQDEEEEKKEQERMRAIEEEMYKYIQKDLELEEKDSALTQSP